MRFLSILSGLLAVSACALPLVSALPISTKDIATSSSLEACDTDHGFLISCTPGKGKGKAVAAAPAKGKATVAASAKGKGKASTVIQAPATLAKSSGKEEFCGEKVFNNQAYKFISTNASKVSCKIPKRTGVVYVLPAGTCQRLLGEAKDFEESRDAERAENFIVKDNKPGDIGIQGIAKNAATGKTQLNLFRNLIICSVYAKGGKSSSQFFTLDKNGKGTNTATKSDQELLRKIGQA